MSGRWAATSPRPASWPPGPGARGLLTAVGLQARCGPAIRYVTDLIAQGYAGEILSATLVGSGGSWGATIPSAAARYLADPADGATMLSIPFGHTIDAVAAALGEPAVQHATLATRRPMVLDADSGEHGAHDRRRPDRRDRRPARRRGAVRALPRRA